MVLTAFEIRAIFTFLDAHNPEFALFAKLIFGTGMRILEAARLRVKDIDFERGAIVIREAKGEKDSVVMLPSTLRDAVKRQIEQRTLLWQSDVDRQKSGVEMPFAFEKKYPRAGHSLAWFWVFPQKVFSTAPRSNVF